MSIIVLSNNERFVTKVSKLLTVYGTPFMLHSGCNSKCYGAKTFIIDVPSVTYTAIERVQQLSGSKGVLLLDSLDLNKVADFVEQMLMHPIHKLLNEIKARGIYLYPCPLHWAISNIGLDMQAADRQHAVDHFIFMPIKVSIVDNHVPGITYHVSNSICNELERPITEHLVKQIEREAQEKLVRRAKKRFNLQIQDKLI